VTGGAARLRGTPAACHTATVGSLGRTHPASRNSPKVGPALQRNSVPAVPHALRQSSGRVRVTGAGRRGVPCAASSSLREIPVFPLNMVAHPSVIVPLNIFEARYRVLFSTLLAGSPGLEEGLVNEESPFAATREFGMCHIGKNGELSAVGTLLRIEEHHKHDDGRLAIVSKGTQKFRIVEVTQERPVLQCTVEFLERDSDAEKPELVALRDEVAELCGDTVRLICKMQQIPVPDQPELRDLDPYELSHWVAFTYERDSTSQQTLLELNSTELRLQTERDRLKANLGYLSAASALENAFKEDSSSA